MASSFKIPKKKQAADSDSALLHMQSPLSRLQRDASQFKSYGDPSSRGSTDRVHAGNSQGSPADRQSSTPCKPFFRDVVKSLLGLNSPNGGAATANQRAAGSSSSSQSEPRQRASMSNGWRPKRASDRLLQPPSSPQKKRGLSPASKSISVRSVDSLAELRAQEHAGRLSTSSQRRVESSVDAAEGSENDDRDSPEKKTDSSDDGLVSLFTPKPSTVSTATPDRRRSLDRTSWLGGASGRSAPEEVMEKKRQTWSEFREKKMVRRSAVLKLRLREKKQSEPIVLSSEEDGEDEADAGRRVAASSRKEAESRLGNREQKPEGEKARPPSTDETPPPSFLQLQFSSLHAGLTHANANGELLVTEQGVTIPLTGGEDGEEAEVTVVASQVRGYGVWDGGVARGGALLEGWIGPAPSLLFLWVSDAQANVLQRELSDVQTRPGPPCSFLLLVLKEQLQELQAALLASILDMDQYRTGFSSSSGGPSSPLEWTDGLLLLHSCPPPLDRHLLGLLGHSADKSAQSRTIQKRKSDQICSGLKQLPSRLIQYPAAPCKGRISVSKEDLACLAPGEFLNDVIIDFYLKYLLLEGVGGSVADRTHIFSSFFYKQLSRRRAAGEDGAPSVPDRHVRHQRVKTWTRHVDIFTKDFMLVPVNQEAHWFLVVVCFPALEDTQYVEFQSRKGGSEEAAGRRSLSLRSQHPPDCTEQGRLRNTVLKRPCILIMDSLKLSYRENVCRLLREYLQVEWEVRRGTPRLFTSDSMRSSNCRVPQQDNSSDCGLYLLQFAETFLQNPVVHFDLPLRLDNWFPRQRVRQKREEIRGLIMKMHQSQQA